MAALPFFPFVCRHFIVILVPLFVLVKYFLLSSGLPSLVESAGSSVSTQCFAKVPFLKKFVQSFTYFWLCWIFVAVCGLSPVATSRGYYLLFVCFSLQCLLVAEHGLEGTWASLLHGTWDLPSSGIKPIFLALAGGFLTTRPSGKS